MCVCVGVFFHSFSWLFHGVYRESEQILKKSGMKRVLLLGSGYVSRPVVEYLTRDTGTQVTVGKWVTRLF